jgi:EAL domain-containing protein (putative c-di-GMP-specific phosphodiesterase class I)
VVDDDLLLLEVYADLLTEAGYDVEVAAGAVAAQRHLEGPPFDVVLTDIVMPDASGLEVLRAARRRDLDVPVILITGSPSLQSAIEAIEMGAMRYLVKPVPRDELLGSVQHAVRLRRLASLKREAISHLGGGDRLVGDRAGLEVVFGRGVQAMWLAYQPIFRASDRTIFGYEALLRSGEPTVASPLAFIQVAERLGRMPELGQVVRESIARARESLGPGPAFFVNIHALELDDERLFSSSSPLSRYAGDVVLEVTERLPLDGIRDLSERVRALRGLGYRIAVDDLGAGYAGLTSFAALEPDFVKLDRELISGLDREPIKRKLVSSMASLCRQLGIGVVAEGVETAAELDAVVGLGCDLVQGFFLRRPGPLPPHADAAAAAGVAGV